MGASRQRWVTKRQQRTLSVRWDDLGRRDLWKTPWNGGAPGIEEAPYPLHYSLMDRITSGMRDHGGLFAGWCILFRGCL